MAIAANLNRRPWNHPCPSVRVCPVGARIQEGFRVPRVDAGKRIVRKKCVRHCPMGAIRDQ